MASAGRLCRLILSLLVLRGLATGKEVNDLEIAPAAAAASAEPSNSNESTLDVLRCCRANEDLDRPGPNGQVRCIPSDTPFQPIIYSPEVGIYLKSIPTWWRIHEKVVPKCAENQVLRYVQKSKSNPYILFESGLLITEFGVGTELNPDEYCMGSNALMACMPKNEGLPAAATMQPRIRKCCGPNAAYDKLVYNCFSLVNNNCQSVIEPIYGRKSHVNLHYRDQDQF